MKSSMTLHSPTIAPNLMGQRNLLQPKATCLADSQVFDCDQNPNGDLVACSLWDANVMVYETQGGSMVYKIPKPVLQDRFPAPAVKFRPVDIGGLQNVAIVAYSSGHIYQWHVPTGKSLTDEVEPRQTLAAAYSCDGLTYATSGSDYKIIVYDACNGKQKNLLEASSSLTIMDGHMSRVFVLRFHPHDPHVIISGGWDNTVQFWDIRQEQSVRKISGPHICGDSLDIEPNTLAIATGSWRYDQPLEIWDYGSGECISSMTCCTGTKLYGTCWVDERHVLVGGTKKHYAALVDITTDKIVGDMKDLPAGVYSVNYNRRSKISAIATGTNVHLCNTSVKVPTPFTVEDEK